MTTITTSLHSPLPLRVQIFYAIGQLGWSTLVNIIGLQLVFFYLPPDNAGIPTLITQAVFFVVLNAITLIAASGRLFDAITDPLIANLSDRSTNPRGRRIPFMMWGALPAALFCILMFTPPTAAVSGWNIVWLVVIQLLFYFALTTYVTPYFALLPELGKTANERLNLSTWISITYALGILVAAAIPAVAGALQPAFGLTTIRSFQAAVAVISAVACLLMYVPVFTIDERTYAQRESVTIPLFDALRTTLRNPNFIYYVVADFAYFMGITIIQTGLLFYITVLLGLDDELVLLLLGMTVLLSFVFYPLVNLLAKKWNKKILVVISFLGMSAIFLSIYFLGRGPIPTTTQAYLFAITYSIPLAFLGVLPNAILADIAEHDALQTGQPKEGMYFAARTLMQKFGQTFGIFVFAMLTTLGKDPGDDLGIRLSGLFGFVLCLLAGLLFIRYNERQLLQEIERLNKG